MSIVSKLFKGAAVLSAATMLAACTGGGGGSTSTYGAYYSPTASVSQFVSALNSIEGYNADGSYVELYTDETIRSTYAGEDDWFVIYDDKYNEYKAVSLQYIRSIVYYDYYSNATSLAREFRSIERDDINFGDINGDFWGDDYEVVDYDYWTNTFIGRNSGFQYEDEAATTDVSLMTAELEQKEFIKKAANVSFAFNVGIETSMSLVTLGKKAEELVKKSGGELTTADELALTNDLQKLTGVSLAEVMAAANDQAAQDDLVGKIADKIGTSASNLENKILPELFGLQLQ
ncbi:MAG: hypothetical protein COW01_05475 [Bdellovibrionales bacterium CG12_big_fil_rev_8_21_14_0_65_38_15]|nr:MAG: hypothetical protein COW79_02990 [Bdellovibrionales bacterium CG22_combo_CG10-13_8_21_14_all_38_13]PIQ56078.1 MAG: hypothetical protein COW01_05475 [Bdellovibrionales bacterium CG12_big_fil_rev_8_21_14_0_65_38_15]PIR28626.1 MAG: hypothetical protein COV38_14780 [Bdellovibrionales bacterium CG11_big_fil_rev_8_21_14_0_20_38_13]